MANDTNVVAFRQGRFSSWSGPLRLLLVLALAAPMLAAAPIMPSSAAPHAHPALLQLAAKNPDSIVNVIVQKSDRSSTPEKMVTSLGGTVTQDLHIINAFGATLEAGGVPQLASSSGVRWVSMDAPVAKSEASPQVVNWATQQGATNLSSISNPFSQLEQCELELRQQEQHVLGTLGL